MKPVRFIWFYRLDGLGEEALDLFRCRRFRIVEFNPNPNDLSSYAEFGLTYYLTDESRWIEYRVDEDYDEVDGKLQLMITDSFRECDPRVVAHQFLYHKAYKLNLPTELEEFRAFGDFSTYQEWLGESLSTTSHNANAKTPLVPHWDRPSRRVVFGSHLCKQFSRRAPAQWDILDGFQSKGWPRTLRSPVGNSGRLKDTVDTMNKWTNSLISFRQNGYEVFWAVNHDKANSAKTP